MQWLADDTELAINRQILTALLRSDIEIKGDYNPKIFHQKFILRDARVAIARAYRHGLREARTRFSRERPSTTTTVMVGRSST